MTTNSQHGKVVEQLLALSPSSMRQPIQIPNQQATQNESPPSAITSFLSSLTSHYASLADPVTPHLFAQLCRNYNTGKYDERAFYVTAYRLFLSTNSTHLMHGFRAFLPLGWREIELGWLDRAIEAEVDHERRVARTHIGELAEMVEGGARVPEILTGSASRPVGDDVDLEATPKPTPAATKKKKKKTPTNGFRSSDRPQPNSTATPLRPFTPKSGTKSDEASPPQISLNSKTSPTIGPSPLSTSESSEPSSTAKPPPNKERPFKRPLPLTLPQPSTDTTSQASSSTPSTPRTTKQYHKHQSSLPSASTISHVSPIYPTTRAIIARPQTKPYIHAPCGARFGYPSEVHRHHKGQSGRPGCWEKSGKPAGDDGKWDAHESCKVGLKDLEYVKVQEGYVVVDWGETDDWLREERGSGNADHGTSSTVSAGMSEEMETEADLQPQADSGGGKTRVEANEAGDDSDDAGEVNDDDYAVPSDEETPKAKRQKINDIKHDTASVANADASVRAAALGLRTRK